MGSWRIVKGKGSCAPNEAKEIIELLTVDKVTRDSDGYQQGIFYMQMGQGLMGINQWVDKNGVIDFEGTLFERNCEIEDLLKELAILANKFSTLEMSLQVFGDYQDTNLEATISVKNKFVRLSNTN